MAVTYDTQSSVFSTGSSVNHNHTTGGGDNVLLVYVGMRGPGAETVTGITYDSNALTLLKVETQGTDFRGELWMLKNPERGTKQISTTLSGAPTGFGVSASTFNRSNGDVTGVEGAGADNSTPSVTILSKPGDMAVDFVGIEEGDAVSATEGPGQTNRQDVTTANQRNVMSTEPGAASNVMTWALSGAKVWVQIAAGVNSGTQGQVQFDNVSTDTTESNTTTETFSHTCSGNNRMLIVSICSRSVSPTGVTYNGVAMTSAGTKSGGPFPAFMFYLANPPLGANDVVVTFDSTGEHAVMAARSYVNSNGTVSGYDTASGNTNVEGQPTVDITSNNFGMVVDTLGGGYSNHSPTRTPGAGQTEEYDLDSTATPGDRYGAGSRELGSATTTMSWSGLAANDDWGLAALNINGGSQFSSKFRLMQY